MSFTRLIAGSFLGLVFCISVLSCDKKVGMPPKIVPVKINFCDTIKFSKNIKPLILGNCATSGCHVSGGSGPGDFTLYADIKTSVDGLKFKLRVFDSPTNPMPSVGMLTQDKLNVIKCWLDSGAPNN